MAASLEELVGLGDVLTIGGEKYTTTPMSANDWALCQAEIKKDRPDATQVALKLVSGLPPDDPERRRLLERAYEDSVRAKQITHEELEAWKGSIQGICFCFWRMLIHHHPEITLERATALLEQFGQEALDTILEQLQPQFPDMTAEDLAAVMRDEGGAGNTVLASLIAKGYGLPAKNPESPTQDPKS